MKTLKKIVLYLSGTIILLILAGLLLSVIYKDRITQAILSELNQNVRTEIKAEKIDFSLLRKFPFASVEFKNIMARSVPSFEHNDSLYARGDTLFNLSSLFLEFNLLDLYRKNYKIKSIHAVSGTISLAIDRNGQANYEFWKPADKKAGSAFNLQLQSVKLSKIRFEFTQIQKHIKLDAQLDRAALRGDLMTDAYDLWASFDGKLLSLSIDSTVLFNKLDLDAEIPLRIDHHTFKLQDGRLSLAGNPFTISGSYSNDKENSVNISLSCEKFSLVDLPILLPKSFMNYSADASGKGYVSVLASLNGKISDRESPGMTISVATKKTPVLLHFHLHDFIKTSFKATYFHEKNSGRAGSVLHIEHFSSVLNDDAFELSGSVRNFSIPVFDLFWKGTVDLSTIYQFIPYDTLGFFHGKVSGNLHASGQFPIRGKLSATDFAHFTYGGALSLHGIKITNHGILLGVSELSGKLKIADDWLIEQMNATLDSNQIEGTGILHNFLPWLLMHGETLLVSGIVTSNHFDLEKLISARKRDTSDSSGIRFPDHINLDLYFKAKTFEAGRFNANNVSGKINYQPFYFDLKSFYFETMEGNLRGSAIMLQKPDLCFIIRTQAKLDQVNITTLFHTFHNFGQALIEEKHLRGKISGYLNFSSEWKNSLDIKPETMLADGNAGIVNGELVDFEPLKGLSKYINVSELEHIYFSNLQFDMFIRNRVITIPQMDIKSASFDIIGSGTHDFDNNFNYKLRVSLSEQLYKKARNSKKEVDEFGIIETEGERKITLPLLLKGNIDNYKISFDARQATRNMIQNLKKEKSELKNLLNNEFKPFKKDSADLQQQFQNKKDNFVIEWDNENYQSGQKKPLAPAKKGLKPLKKKDQQDTSKLKIEWE